jgi:glutamate 5-kinase
MKSAPDKRYRRVVAKVGTNLLTAGGDSLDRPTIASLVAQVAALQEAGLDVVVVTSGAIAAGRDALGVGKGRRDVPFNQMLAAVGQGRLMHLYHELFQQHGINVAQVLITKGDLDNREGYLNVRNTMVGLLGLGVVPLVNENDVVDVREIGEAVFGDNDSLSAAVANLVDADLLAILTDIDGLYTADPRRDPQAKLIEQVDRIDGRIEALAGGTGGAWARGGMVTKIEAARSATLCGIPVAIANGQVPQVMERLVAGEAIGTLFTPSVSKVDSRQRWMLSGLSARGSITIDEGAARALTGKSSSLLPAGIRGVEGDFGRGDLVDIVDADGSRIGCGLTNYGAVDLDKIRGANSSEILKLLGYRFGDEVVHRNDLVILDRVAQAS